MSGSRDKRIELIDCKPLYACGTNKGIIHKNKEIKCENIIKQYKKKKKSIDFDDVTGENTRRNPSWPEILDHPYRILIYGGSGSGKKMH